jgi:stage II sporulation protein P
MSGMKFRRRYRFSGKWLAVSIFLLFFSFGVLLGYYYDSDKTSFLPVSLVVKSQLFYGGKITNLPGYVDTVEAFSEYEKSGDVTLTDWELTFYEDELTNTTIPVFYGKTETASGKTEASSTELIRVNAAKEVAMESLDPEEVRVLIYCTHTAESYAGNKADENGRGDVLTVAHHLGDTLQNDYGVGVVISDTVHDSPDWYQSYSNSKVTAAALWEAYPEADLMIDLHRDSSTTKADCTVSVNGENAASLLLVVGSNVTLNHPNWEQNWQTSKTIGSYIDAVNASLLRGVRVQKGRYNQHLSTKMILLEVGTDLNTLPEAEYSAELVAEAINRYLENLE